jgi:hypothetical protein
MVPGAIAGQGIGHLDRRLRVLAPLEDRREVLSPAWPGPVLNSAIGPLAVSATTPQVKTPVRSRLAPGGNASARAAAVNLRMRMGVSSL